MDWSVGRASRQLDEAIAAIEEHSLGRARDPILEESLLSVSRASISTYRGEDDTQNRINQQICGDDFDLADDTIQEAANETDGTITPAPTRLVARHSRSSAEGSEYSPMIPLELRRRAAAHQAVPSRSDSGRSEHITTPLGSAVSKRSRVIRAQDGDVAAERIQEAVLPAASPHSRPSQSHLAVRFGSSHFRFKEPHTKCGKRTATAPSSAYTSSKAAMETRERDRAYAQSSAYLIRTVLELSAHSASLSPEATRQRLQAVYDEACDVRDVQHYMSKRSENNGRRFKHVKGTRAYRDIEFWPPFQNEANYARANKRYKIRQATQETDSEAENDESGDNVGR